MNILHKKPFNTIRLYFADSFGCDEIACWSIHDVIQKRFIAFTKVVMAARLASCVFTIIYNGQVPPSEQNDKDRFQKRLNLMLILRNSTSGFE